jgi:hypothetical protein
MTYDNTNKGVLRKNDKKTQDTHAEYRGNINVEGVEYWLSAWVNEHENMGGKYFKISVQKKEQK